MDGLEGSASGWLAIESEFARLYGEQEARHVGYMPGRAFGSVLQGCSAYRASDYWHFVTFGLSNIFDDEEPDNDGYSGMGYELTWRVRRGAPDAETPDWPFDAIQKLAKWSIDAEVVLGEHTRIHLKQSVTGFPHTDDPDTNLRGLLLAEDSEIGTIATPNGSVQFLQLVAVTEEAMRQATESDATAVVAELRKADPLLVTEV